MQPRQNCLGSDALLSFLAESNPHSVEELTYIVRHRRYFVLNLQLDSSLRLWRPLGGR